MMSRLYQSFRDYSLLSQVSAVLFIAGIFVSTYYLLALPGHLSQSPLFGSGIATLRDPVLVRLVAVVLITLLLGMTGLVSAVKDKREVVVFREKTVKTGQQTNGADTQTGQSIDLTEFTRLLEKDQDGPGIIQQVLNKVSQLLEAGQGAVYLVKADGERRYAELQFGFAIAVTEGNPVQYDLGEGLIGQAAASGNLVYVEEVPEGYIQILSGLGSASPRFILIVPIRTPDRVLGVMELATFGPVSEVQRAAVKNIGEMLAAKIEVQ